MVKISALPPDTAPSGTDYLPTVDAETNQTKRVLLSDLANYLYSNAPYPTETGFDYIASGGVWSADAAGSTRAASMTAMVCYINGRRISIAAVTARTFTASVDTYVDVLDNGDGTGTLVYTTAVNNAASAALAGNSLRIAIIVTGATTIAASTSINQGQETRVLPIASSIPYAVTDSLGNLICPRDPQRKLLGLRIVQGNFTTTSASVTQMTGLTVPVLAPLLRKIKLTYTGSYFYNSGANYSEIGLWDGTVGSGTQLGFAGANGTTARSIMSDVVTTPATASKTYNAGMSVTAGTGTQEGASTRPVALRIELD